MPVASTADEFEAITEQQLRPGVIALARRLKVSDVERFPDGSLPVYAFGADVLKLYPAVYASERDLESSVLLAIDGKLGIPTPVVRQVGEFDGWGYLLMSRLPGESLKSAWSRVDRTGMAEQLGEALAQLHSIEMPELGPSDWDEFIAAQRAGCVERQRARGLDEKWLEQIPEFLDRVDLAPARRNALLHTEVMREHLLTEHGSLSGLFDFEPAMRGAPEYEFAAVGLYVSGGDTDFLRRTLLAYGYTHLDASLSRRFLAYLLLHKFSCLRTYLTQVPSTAETLDDLAEDWWSLA